MKVTSLFLGGWERRGVLRERFNLTHLSDIARKRTRISVFAHCEVGSPEEGVKKKASWFQHADQVVCGNADDGS